MRKQNHIEPFPAQRSTWVNLTNQKMFGLSKLRNIILHHPRGYAELFQSINSDLNLIKHQIDKVFLDMIKDE